MQHVRASSGIWQGRIKYVQRLREDDASKYTGGFVCAERRACAGSTWEERAPTVEQHCLTWLQWGCCVCSKTEAGQEAVRAGSLWALERLLL